jgi:hypothetical protein
VPGIIVDNALNTIGGPASTDIYSGDTRGGTVEFRALQGPWFTSAGVLVSPAEVPIDQTSGSFNATLFSTDLDILTSGARYVAVFKRYGTELARTAPFEVPDGSSGPLAAFVDLSSLEEGQLSGRSLDYAETDTPMPSVDVTTPTSFPSGLVIAPTIGLRPILLEAIIPQALPPSNPLNILILEIYDMTVPTTPLRVARNVLGAGGSVQELHARRRFRPPQGERVYEAKVSQGSSGSGGAIAISGESLFSLEAIER